MLPLLCLGHTKTKPVQNATHSVKVCSMRINAVVCPVRTGSQLEIMTLAKNGGMAGKMCKAIAAVVLAPGGVIIISRVGRMGTGQRMTCAKNDM